MTFANLKFTIGLTFAGLALMLVFSPEARAWGDDTQIEQINSMLDGVSSFSFANKGEVTLKTNEWDINKVNGQTTFKQTRGTSNYVISDTGEGTTERRVSFTQNDSSDGASINAFTARFSKGELRSILHCQGERMNGSYKNCTSASGPVCSYLRKKFGDNMNHVFDEIATCQKFFTPSFVKELNSLQVEREEQESNRTALGNLIQGGAQNPNPLLAPKSVTSFPENPEAYYGGGFAMKALLQTVQLCRDLKFVSVDFKMPDVNKSGHF